MQVKFMAGEMARLHNISKQSLLHYDRIGLFKPREVHSRTGYRYYTLDQFEDLDVILCLKNLGMKLEEIKTYLTKESIDERITILEDQESLIRQKILEIKRTRGRLSSIITALKSRRTIDPMDMGIRWFDTMHVVREPVESPHDLYALELAIKKLFQITRGNDQAEDHELLTCAEVSPETEERFQSVALQVPGATGATIPAGEYAYLYHKGRFEDLPLSRAKLWAHIARQGYTTDNTAIEKVLLNSLAVPREDDYLIEIRMPVTKSPAP
ncbi:MerR family transcriptional regulator [Desulfoluna butyratoxydans]|uniref:Merr-type hth domain n=1 Tax=Desulfoluna butyratoxydans TaxID=231438 RepID=A0A4V6IL32_9BACT|nr:MerR family transcriptional regulator [Desulfoluna butyratoxydans]VFQ43598.1 merr-type hth domain [Desulfoluna butyratoxydans]